MDSVVHLLKKWVGYIAWGLLSKLSHVFFVFVFFSYSSSLWLKLKIKLSDVFPIYLLDIAKVNFSVVILNSGFRFPDFGFWIPIFGFRFPVSRCKGYPK